MKLQNSIKGEEIEQFNMFWKTKALPSAQFYA